MKRQWYYRGSLKFCNYTCSYCPFSKRKGSEKMLLEDKRAFFRFIERFCSREDAGGALQIIPYGEALIHPYYWEGLARLSRNPRLDAVGAQSNFSFPTEQMLSVYQRHGGDLGMLRLWGTFHPEMTCVEQFVSNCEALSAHGVSYCVGAVGVPQQIETIRRLRERLSSQVYLWINKMDGLGRKYTEAEAQAFLEIDPYFEMELAYHKADAALCGDNRFVEADGTMHLCNLCRQELGNFYDEVDNRTDVRKCTRKECGCYIAYCNRTEEHLLFFQPYPAFRIPSYPKALFIDADGTLIPEGECGILDRYVRWVNNLEGRCDIYLATSLSYEAAKRKAAPIWQALRGGVFANGGRWMVFDKKDFPRANDGRRSGRDTELLDGRVGNCIHVTKRGTDKLEGILDICQCMGYALEDAVVIGNSEDDIPMLKHFPFSVAAKGSDVSVRECAKLVFN